MSSTHRYSPSPENNASEKCCKKVFAQVVSLHDYRHFPDLVVRREDWYREDGQNHKGCSSNTQSCKAPIYSGNEPQAVHLCPSLKASTSRWMKHTMQAESAEEERRPLFIWKLPGSGASWR